VFSLPEVLQAFRFYLSNFIHPYSCTTCCKKGHEISKCFME